MVSTDQSLGMQTKQTQVFNQYKKEQPPPPSERHFIFLAILAYHWKNTTKQP